MSSDRGMPPLSRAMTSFPWFVEADDSLQKAREVMRDQEIRHLPVKEEGELAGIVSERDIHLVERATPAEARGALRVRDAWSEEPYTVDMTTPMDRVLLEMARRHIGSALVVREDKLAGILTVTDVCRFFGEALRDWFPPPDGDEAA